MLFYFVSLSSPFMLRFQSGFPCPWVTVAPGPWMGLEVLH